MSGAGLYTRLLFPRRLRGDSLGFVGCGRRATYPPEPWAVTSSNFNVGCGIPKPDHTKTALCSFWFSALCYIYTTVTISTVAICDSVAQHLAQVQVPTWTLETALEHRGLRALQKKGRIPLRTTPGKNHKRLRPGVESIGNL